MMCSLKPSGLSEEYVFLDGERVEGLQRIQQSICIPQSRCKKLLMLSVRPHRELIFAADINSPVVLIGIAILRESWMSQFRMAQTLI